MKARFPEGIHPKGFTHDITHVVLFPPIMIPIVYYICDANSVLHNDNTGCTNKISMH
jgi:hypothetical protein